MIMAKKELCLNSNYFGHLLVLLYFIPITWFDEHLLFVKNHKVDCFKIKQNTQKILHCQNRSKTICISLHIIFPQNNSYLMYSSSFPCDLFLVICYSSSFPCDLFLVICLFLAHVNPASKQPTVDFAIQKKAIQL